MLDANVNYKVTADNKSAIAAFTQVQAGAKKMNASLNKTIGGGLGTFFSAAAIGMAVKSSFDWADSIDEASKRLKISNSSVQTLMRSAKLGGTEFEKIESAMLKIDKAAQNAIGGDAKKQKAFAALGISSQDQRTASKDSLIQKAAAGALKLDTAQADQALREIFGDKLVGVMQGAADELSRMEQTKNDMIAAGQMVSDEDIAAIAAMKDEIDLFGQKLSAFLAPILVTVIGWLTAFFTQIGQLAEYLGTAIGAFSTVIGTVKPWELIKAFGENIVGTFQAVFSNLWDLVRGKISFGELFENLGEQMQKNVDNALSKGFDKNAMDAARQTMHDKLLELGERDKQSAAAKERLKANNAKTQEQGVRQGTPSGSKSTFKQEELKTSDKLLSIGGVAGINANYRLERNTTEMVKLLEKVVEELKTDNTTDADEYG